MKPTDPEQLGRANRLFAEALEQPEEERTAWLRRACAGDDALGAMVLQLLLLADSAGEDPTWLKGGLAAQASMLGALFDDAPLSAGTQLGNYLVREEIGRGGMAVVYSAERADGAFDHPVALKMMKRGLASAEAMARFHDERRILARIRHPHIATLLDAGVSEHGQPFFVMELVDGAPIDRYVAANRLGLRARLALFLQICEAVGFAHRNLVVHRDLKPSNILVTQEGVVKLLDFGIAKVASDDDEAAELTRADQRFLTPMWASPEQLRGHVVATASDQYQLGLILFLLVTGRSLRDGQSTDPIEMARSLDATTTTRPSAAVARATGAEIEEKFGMTAARLQRSVRGDLDTIVARALDLEPERRYPAVPQLADDVKRYLDGRPITARPDSAWYRLGKLAKRNRVASSLVAALGILLLGLAVVMSVQAGRLARERDRANREAELSKQVTGFLMQVFQSSDPSKSRGNQVTTREILDKMAAELDTKMQETSAIKAELQTTLGQVYRSLGIHDRAETFYRAALDAYDALDGPESESALKAQSRLATNYREMGKLDQAQEILERLIPIAARVFGEQHAETLNDMNTLGAIYADRQDNERAGALFERVSQARLATLGPEHIDTLRTQVNLAVNLRRRGKQKEAQALLQSTTEVLTRTIGADDPTTMAARANLAGVVSDLGGLKESKRLFADLLEDADRVLGPDNTLSSVAIQNLAWIAEENDDRPAAEKLYRRALESLSRKLIPDHPQVINAKHNLGLTLVVMNKDLDQAERLVNESYDAARRVQGDKSYLVARNLFALALLSTRRGHVDSAIEFFQRAVQSGFDDPDLLALTDSTLKGRKQYDELAAKVRVAAQ